MHSCVGKEHVGAMLVNLYGELAESEKRYISPSASAVNGKGYRQTDDSKYIDTSYVERSFAGSGKFKLTTYRILKDAKPDSYGLVGCRIASTATPRPASMPPRTRDNLISLFLLLLLLLEAPL